MAKENLTNYSNAELSLRVFNDENLYRRRNRRDFIAYLRELFVFDDEQLMELQDDLVSDEITNEEAIRDIETEEAEYEHGDVSSF